MRKIYFMISLFIVAFTFSNCKEKENQKVLTKEVAFEKEGVLSLHKSTNDSLIVELEIEIAEGDYETQTGLMYRSSMHNNRGMLFVFETESPRSFYMKNTQFPLDIIYFNANGELVSIQKNAQPFSQSSLPSEGPAKYVLEVNAGLSENWGLQKGDLMEFTRL